MTGQRPRVVLYNPRAVFYTMPLGLMALASALDRSRVDVVIIDGRLEADPVAAVVDAARDAVCVGISVLTGAPIRDALAVSRAVKTAQPRCTVVWGGWHPSLFPRECLAERAIDVVVQGQGEVTFREIVDRLLAGRTPAGCAGTTARIHGEVVAAPPRPLADLNTLPPHDYSLIPVGKYFKKKRTRQIDYVSSQGCRFRCAFCADPAVFGRAWSGLAPERVAAEAETLVSRYAMRELAFQDETFFTSAARVDAIAEAFLSRNLGISWTATLRADQACRLGEQPFARAVRSGLRRVMVGVESGSQDTLDRLSKDVTIEQVRRTAELCVRHGIGAIFNFIVGFPGEPEASIRATLSLVKELRQASPAFETPVFSYRPYPGNAMADQAVAEGYVFPRELGEWADFDYVGSRGPWLSAPDWDRLEAFQFYVRHAWKPGLWRSPLRLASRVRCSRDWYRWPIEKRLVEFVRPAQPVS